MLPRQLEALIQRVRTALESGLSIAIVGWRDINHNQFTAKLPEKKVLFLDASPVSLPERVGLVLFTKYMDHTTSAQIGRRKPVYKIVLEVRDIRTILESCKDVMIIPSHGDTTKAAAAEPAATTAPANELSDAALNLITTPREKYEMNKMDCLTKAFLDAANANKECLISMKELARIRGACDIKETPQQLVSTGWIEGVTAGGKTKIGWYKAGPKMLENTGPQKAEEPEDPYEWAKWRVAQEDAVLAKKAEIEAELAKVVAEIAEIGLAKEALARLNDLKSSKKQ